MVRRIQIKDFLYTAVVNIMFKVGSAVGIGVHIDMPAAACTMDSMPSVATDGLDSVALADVSGSSGFLREQGIHGVVLCLGCLLRCCGIDNRRRVEEAHTPCPTSR